jgi:hypothetical protein
VRGSTIALAAISTATAAAVLVPSVRPPAVDTPTGAPTNPKLPYPCLMFRHSQAPALRTQCATATLLWRRARALERDPLR